MNSTQLKGLVFERFEERRAEIIKKRNHFQQELVQDVRLFREAYGEDALQSLGDIALIVVSASKEADNILPESARATTRSKKKPKRRQKPDGAPTARSQLEQRLPAAIETVAAKKDEFMARDLYDQLTKVSGFDVTYSALSAYLGKNFKMLGLTVEKRTEGKPIPRPTFFFRKKGVKGASASGSRKKAP